MFGDFECSRFRGNERDFEVAVELPKLFPISRRLSNLRSSINGTQRKWFFAIFTVPLLLCSFRLLLFSSFLSFFSLKKKEIDHRFAARADIRFLMRTLRPRTRLSRLRRLQHCGLRIVPAIVISFVRFLETRESNIIDPCIVLIGEFATIKREQRKKEKKLEQHTLYHRIPF